ncbi:DUF2061 domain-containing protein [Lacinutrix neustonica]|uniref:DUF2061 domain-containing protein n=1 Tax=Lacinutrix neustonica TaxID=2980107 RepID=A0A9E8MV70_9FLAO|nr:DUF2061 domain-containing protein [Lacinutrix neustonica]WAC01524.1 DUF2061 domain-containing protein [Lacinutrix neustonica]
MLDILYKREYTQGTKKQVATAGEVAEASKENVKRSLVKTISWRVIGTLDTVLVSYLVTGTMAMALSIGSFEFVSKMILYFFHERAWNKIKWGK